MHLTSGTCSEVRAAGIGLSVGKGPSGGDTTTFGGVDDEEGQAHAITAAAMRRRKGLVAQLFPHQSGLAAHVQATFGTDVRAGAPRGLSSFAEFAAGSGLR